MTFETHKSINPGVRRDRPIAPAASALAHPSVNPGERHPAPTAAQRTTGLVRANQPLLGAIVVGIAATLSALDITASAGLWLVAGYLLRK